MNKWIDAFVKDLTKREDEQTLTFKEKLTYDLYMGIICIFLALGCLYIHWVGTLIFGGIAARKFQIYFHKKNKNAN
jgi:hypothetical protein